MGFGLRLLKLAAKVGLDCLMGSTRTDEAVALLEEWWSQHGKSRDRELAEAKKAVTDSNELDDIVKEAVVAKGRSATPDQIEALLLGLSSGFTAMPVGIDLKTAPWAWEWIIVPPAKRLPRQGTKSRKLFECINRTPSSYRKLRERAGFAKDPFLRTSLRKWARAGWIHRTVDADGTTELWSLPNDKGAC